MTDEERLRVAALLVFSRGQEIAKLARRVHNQRLRLRELTAESQEWANVQRERKLLEKELVGLREQVQLLIENNARLRARNTELVQQLSVFGQQP